MKFQEPANSFILFLNYGKQIEYNVIHSNDHFLGYVVVVTTLYQKREVIAFLFSKVVQPMEIQGF